MIRVLFFFMVLAPADNSPPLGRASADEGDVLARSRMLSRLLHSSRGIAAAVIGDIRPDHSLTVSDADQTLEFFDLQQGLTGFRNGHARRHHYA